MKVITTKSPGGPDVLRCVDLEWESPALKNHEVLIQVMAAGINRPDILQRKGAYPPPPGASPILGLEVAGKIVALGPHGSHNFKVGDSVCALVAGGGYSEYCIAPAEQCLPIPSGLSMVEAAAVPETFFTVWSNVFMRGRLSEGERFLVHGGTSGIGTTAIQLARAFGAEVYATAGSDEKCQACLNLGATRAINYKTQDFAAELRQVPMNVILDMVAGDYFPRNVELLAPEGRLVQIATQKGEQVQLSLRALMSKGGTVTGSLLRPRSPEQKGKIARQLLEKVWPLFESGKIRVIIDKTYPIQEVAAAHQRMESSEHIGKIVLTF